ncbi:AlpA family transcriptional regulator [Planktotalea sp.]|uniref:helix-turn-helix transcriptional regulator n=1 Tax=Planktotalea sp. TaxID=2029877 RepID=UPI00329A3E54
MPEHIKNCPVLERMLRRPAVEEMTGLSRTSIYNRMNLGTFPRAVKIGVTAVAWPESVIQEWIQDQIEESAKRYIV